MQQLDVDGAIVAQLARIRRADRDDVMRALEADGGIDSLEGLELALAAEEEFNINLSDDELSSPVCRSVPALVQLVRSKLAQRPETKEAIR